MVSQFILSNRMRDWESRESGYEIIAFLSSKGDYSVSTSFDGMARLRGNDGAAHAHTH